MGIEPKPPDPETPADKTPGKPRPDYTQPYKRSDVAAKKPGVTPPPAARPQQQPPAAAGRVPTPAAASARSQTTPSPARPPAPPTPGRSQAAQAPMPSLSVKKPEAKSAAAKPEPLKSGAAKSEPPAAPARPGSAAKTPAPKRAGASFSAAAAALFVFLTAGVSGLVGNQVFGPTGLAAALAVAVVGAAVAAAVARPQRVPLPAPAFVEDGPTADETREHSRLDAGLTGGKPGSALDDAAGVLKQLGDAKPDEKELERIKQHVKIAAKSWREGKDPLMDDPELRGGPLGELLEAVREGAASMPVVSRLGMSEEELVGDTGDGLPVPWPAGVNEPNPPGASGPAVSAEARRILEELISGLEILEETLSAGSAGGGVRTDESAASARTPAQLVDAVVHTAADGIEDLAAGLMRANELAGVAERVTNKATLLALNAALEATRSGSEAFAAIAEETRRLAEFAREATDTIARLSSEIEYKVGETIAAIHQTSEDAKSAVASFQSAPAGSAAAPSIPPSRVEALLRRARELRERLAPSGGGASKSAAARILEPDHP